MMVDEMADMCSRVRDGEALFVGEFFWARPDPPLLPERARLLAAHLPSGTLAAGVTAGWLWCGIGAPTPLSLIARSQPAPSPLARHRWKSRGVRVAAEAWQTVEGLPVLTLEATWRDLWTVEGPHEGVAAQLFCLSWDYPHLSIPQPEQLTGVGPQRYALLADWQRRYPWATR